MKGKRVAVYEHKEGYKYSVNDENPVKFFGTFIDWGIEDGVTMAIVLQDEGFVKVVYPESIGLVVCCPEMYEIFGTEIQFSVKVLPNDVIKVARNIWDNPDMYSDYKKGSDGAFYHFLKFLWISGPLYMEAVPLSKFISDNLYCNDGEPPK